MIEQQMYQSRFQGKVAIVTGAGSGIGKAAALRLAKEGAKVILFDLNRERTQQTEAEINYLYPESSRAFDVDISDPIRMERAVHEAAEIFGGIDIVFANAGINGVLAPLDEISFEDWNNTMNINLNGTFLTVKYTVPFLKKSGGGSIIITSSINGSDRFSGFGMSAYSTTKAGQVGFARMAALELAKFKIRVNVICPGAIATNIDQSSKPSAELSGIVIPVVYPQGNQPLADGPGQSEDVADLVSFLASSESKHITGARIVIDGAESML
ncbi:NAD(P)-dependent dehydrogenase (short-subunit alcohol dehydrogenase family) [Paenibacillus shirakamiensis]|uniref:NAD(P)-dependent dehydrogenase (Short-subunit alcohol dehydrogenase family) n=1 Tax=Paenibacillus shirakamiensis TaxID=1265935 RepID=A0ABS4JJ26_9BACL|nr:SDR family NAD(P)-dependent oxidoreductase [Paenibacillus shirakamiensis]MBP2000996.1 NAD(P)-dependent dehydrogenase (short-subunit alcohol dehydrogenase family) [Paenibacillus shirakamiensis]